MRARTEMTMPMTDVGERETLIRKLAIHYRIPSREARRLVREHEKENDA